MKSEIKKTCNVYIISWGNFHGQALEIARSLIGINGKVTIVYSDSDPGFLFSAIDGISLIKRPEQEYFGLKFKACINDCDADLMMIIHADTNSPDWRKVYNRCYESMLKNNVIGIWTPYIEWNARRPAITNISRIGKTSFFLSAWTDTTVFCIRKETIQRMKELDYSVSNYGWGITPMLVAHVCTLSLVPVVDYSLKVTHPSKLTQRGYSSDLAESQKKQFLKQLSAQEKIIHELMNAIQVRNKKIQIMKLRRINYENKK